MTVNELCGESGHFYNRFKKMFSLLDLFLYLYPKQLFVEVNFLKGYTPTPGWKLCDWNSYLSCGVKSYRRNTKNVIKIGWNNKVIIFRSLHCFGETGLYACPHEYAMEELMISYPDFNNLFAFHYWIIALQQLDWLLTYSVR